jgi:enoyl-CoA hydratase/carnithine racemase
MTKRCLHDEWVMEIDEAVDHEARQQAICMETMDFERAYEAFVAKQKPVFRGD